MLSNSLLLIGTRYQIVKQYSKKISFWRLIVCRGWWISRLHNNARSKESLLRLSLCTSHIITIENAIIAIIERFVREHLLLFILTMWYSNLAIELFVCHHFVKGFFYLETFSVLLRFLSTEMSPEKNFSSKCFTGMKRREKNNQTFISIS